MRLHFSSIERLPDLVEAVLPGVVHIDVLADGEMVGQGSGFTIPGAEDDASRTIVVTNAHVVSGGESYDLRFYDDTEEEATLRYSDASTDLALLEAEREPLHALDLRPLAGVRIGEPVLAIGSPYGLSGTVTTGIVSGLDRTVPGWDGIPIDNAIQTDALINPGNSGGPLIGFDGRVIGVNDQVRVSPERGATGLAFAIPAETAWMVYDEICRDGRVRRATIGANLQLRPFTKDEKREWRQKAGALIVDDPEPGTPAYVAGLRRSDVLIALDGTVVDEPGDVYRLLDRTRIEKDCEVVFIREGERNTTLVVPVERPHIEEGDVHARSAHR